MFIKSLFVIRHRIKLFNSLRKFKDVLNLDILLKGSPILTVEENTEGKGGRWKEDLNN
jgi:hypothetical protein